LYRRSARAHELSRRAQRTSSTRSQYRVRHRRLELWTPPQERRGLCQAPDTRMWLNARNVEDETSSIFARKEAPRWKGRVSSFPTRYPEPSESNHTSSGPQDPRPGIQVAYLVSRSRMANRPPSPPPTHPSGCKYRETKRKYVRTRRRGANEAPTAYKHTRKQKHTHAHTNSHMARHAPYSL
jgi:hypothetical protein